MDGGLVGRMHGQDAEAGLAQQPHVQRQRLVTLQAKVVVRHVAVLPGQAQVVVVIEQRLTQDQLTAGKQRSPGFLQQLFAQLGRPVGEHAREHHGIVAQRQRVGAKVARKAGDAVPGVFLQRALLHHACGLGHVKDGDVQVRAVFVQAQRHRAIAPGHVEQALVAVEVDVAADDLQRLEGGAAHPVVQQQRVGPVHRRIAHRVFNHLAAQDIGQVVGVGDAEVAQKLAEEVAAVAVGTEHAAQHWRQAVAHVGVAGPA